MISLRKSGTAAALEELGVVEVRWINKGAAFARVAIITVRDGTLSLEGNIGINGHHPDSTF